MANYKLKDLRNLDLNLYYFVASGLQNYGYIIISGGYNTPHVTSGIYLTDGYPEDFNEIKLPAISIDHSFSRENPYQLGQGKENVRRYSIDIYARTDGERDDLGELVRNFFDQSMVIYNYNDILTNNTYNIVGLADFENIVMRPNRNQDFIALKHQMNISFEANVPVNSGSSLV